MKQDRLLATKNPYELDSKVAVDFGAKHVIFASGFITEQYWYRFLEPLYKYAWPLVSAYVTCLP